MNDLWKWNSWIAWQKSRTRRNHKQREKRINCHRNINPSEIRPALSSHVRSRSSFLCITQASPLQIVIIRERKSFPQDTEKHAIFVFVKHWKLSLTTHRPEPKKKSVIVTYPDKKQLHVLTILKSEGKTLNAKGSIRLFITLVHW